MTRWVRTDVNLDSPVACLTLTERQAVALGLDFRKVLADGPEVVEAVVCDLIEDICPNLAGGALLFVDLDLPGKLWAFHYVHRSLPRTRPGCRALRVPLIPEDREVEFGGRWVFVPGSGRAMREELAGAQGEA